MSSLVAYGESSGSEGEDQPSGSVISSKVRDVKKLLSVLPVPRKGKNQPVRLGIPRLQQPGGLGVS